MNKLDFYEILAAIVTGTATVLGGIFTAFKIRESHLTSKKIKLEMQKLQLEMRKIRRGE